MTSYKLEMCLSSRHRSFRTSGNPQGRPGLGRSAAHRNYPRQFGGGISRILRVLRYTLVIAHICGLAASCLHRREALYETFAPSDNFAE